MQISTWPIPTATSATCHGTFSALGHACFHKATPALHIFNLAKRPVDTQRNTAYWYRKMLVHAMLVAHFAYLGTRTAQKVTRNFLVLRNNGDKPHVCTDHPITRFLVPRQRQRLHRLLGPDHSYLVAYLLPRRLLTRSTNFPMSHALMVDQIQSHG
jgi:hypothetical protein